MRKYYNGGYKKLKKNQYVFNFYYEVGKKRRENFMREEDIKIIQDENNGYVVYINEKPIFFSHNKLLIDNLINRLKNPVMLVAS